MIKIKNGRVITPVKGTKDILDAQMDVYIAEPGEPRAGRIVGLNPTEIPTDSITREIDGCPCPLP